MDAKNVLIAVNMGRIVKPKREEMIQVLENREIKSARKDYSCDSSLWLREAIDDWFEVSKLTFQEKRQVVQARKDGWKIKKGQSYKLQRQIFDGDFVTLRFHPEIDKICHKYELYPEL